MTATQPMWADKPLTKEVVRSAPLGVNPCPFIPTLTARETSNTICIYLMVHKGNRSRRKVATVFILFLFFSGRGANGGYYKFSRVELPDSSVSWSQPCLLIALQPFVATRYRTMS